MVNDSIDRSPLRSPERNYYDRPEIWVRHQHGPSQLERARQTVEMLPGGIESVLDVGCGSGPVTNELAKRFPLVVGLDIARRLLEYIHSHKVQAAAEGLPFRTASFDAVVATELIEHIPVKWQRRVIREMERVCRRYLLISVPFREILEIRYAKCDACGYIFHADRHESSFDRASVEELLGPAFHLVNMQKLGRPDKRIPRLFITFAHAFGGFTKVEPGDTICPECGNGEYFVRKKNLLTRLFWGIPLRLLPLPKSPRWMVTLFRKTTEQ